MATKSMEQRSPSPRTLEQYNEWAGITLPTEYARNQFLRVLKNEIFDSKTVFSDYPAKLVIDEEAVTENEGVNEQGVNENEEKNGETTAHE